MKITFDPSADQAYIAFRDIEPGDVEETYEIPDGPGRRRIWLNFDKDDCLVGIEVWQATLYLPPELLSQAEDEGDAKK